MKTFFAIIIVNLKKKFKNKEYIFLLFFILLNLSLSIYGNDWGLPDRWNVDESVATALKMASQKTIFPPKNGLHPTFYYFFLMLILSPYALYLNLSGFPLEQIRNTAGVSWIKFSEVFPSIATNLYLIARSASALLGVLTVYVVFLIGRRIYNTKIGLYAAGVLSVTMGFVAENHYAKSSSLVVFLATLVVLLCITSLQGKSFHKYFYLAAFTVGLSFSTKYNGGSGILPLLLTYFLKMKSEIKGNIASGHKVCANEKRFLFISKTLIIGLALVLLGVIVGYPGMLFDCANFIKGIIYYKIYLPGSSKKLCIHSHIFIGLRNNFLRLVTIFGIPFFIFLVSGFIKNFKEMKKKFQPAQFVVTTFVIIYFFFASVLQRAPKMATIKHMILIIPILSLYSGKAIYDFITIKKVSNIIKYTVLFSTFIISIIYTFSLDTIFKKADTRYGATKWIEENISPGSTISIFDEVDWLFSSRLLSKYNVNYFGNNSSQSRDRNIFKVINEEELQREYFLRIDKDGVNSDYIINSINSFSTIEDYFEDTDWPNEGDSFMKKLLSGRLGYTLVKKFEEKGNFFWNPKNEYMSPIILVYKK